MAIYTNFNEINEYMKVGSATDSCYICARKQGTSTTRDAYDTMRALEGKLENKKTVVIKKSGINACICMNCIKEIYDTHIAPTLPKETTGAKVETKEVKEEVKVEPQQEVEETAKANPKKKK